MKGELKPENNMA